MPASNGKESPMKSRSGTDVQLHNGHQKKPVPAEETLVNTVQHTHEMPKADRETYTGKWGNSMADEQAKGCRSLNCSAA